MITEAYQTPSGGFKWLDCQDPSGSEIDEIVKKYGLPESAISDYFDPKHLPKIEIIGEHTFLLLRVYNEKAKDNSTSLGELTKRIGVLIGKDHLITIHRAKHTFLNNIKITLLVESNRNENEIVQFLVFKIISGAVSTFKQAIYQSKLKHEAFEEVLFHSKNTTFSIQEKYLIKRKVFIYKKVLKLYLNICKKLEVFNLISTNNVLQLQELAENEYFEVEQILEDVNNLINLRLSLASHYTNEIIRVLTIFSVFFMPINFVLMFFGMNFTPTNWILGYPIVFGLVSIITLLLYLHFHRKKWI